MERERPLSERQRQMLLDVARKTLCFFTRTVTEATHHLPPDNLQLEPARGIAPRTSPTNIGMYLLACVSAMELGLWDADTAGRRIEKTVDTMESMATWNGHLFNWYDVRTLRPLNQRYVSSVDSGNLCACLLLCAQALRGRLSQMDANLLSLPARLDALAAAMDFGALYDGTRDLFYIGVNAQTGPDGGCALRPAGQRIAPAELSGGDAARGAGPALAQAGARDDPHAARRGAAVLERHAL